MQTQFNADLSQRATLEISALEWHAIAHGVFVKQLDADGLARATSVVRLAPDAALPVWDDARGEEIIVLEGELVDGDTRHATGTYLRIPAGMRAALTSATGCLLFIKRYEFEANDRARVRLDTQNTAWLPGLVPGLAVMPLHQHQHEHAALVRWQPDTYFQSHAHFGGEEILVLTGVFEDEFGSYPAGSWLRSPHMSRHQPFSRPGCTIYVKTGHLLADDAQAAPGMAYQSAPI